MVLKIPLISQMWLRQKWYIFNKFYLLKTKHKRYDATYDAKMNVFCKNLGYIVCEIWAQNANICVQVIQNATGFTRNREAFGASARRFPPSICFVFVVVVAVLYELFVYIINNISLIRAHILNDANNTYTTCASTQNTTMALYWAHSVSVSFPFSCSAANAVAYTYIMLNVATKQQHTEHIKQNNEWHRCIFSIRLRHEVEKMVLTSTQNRVEKTKIQLRLLRLPWTIMYVLHSVIYCRYI